MPTCKTYPAYVARGNMGSDYLRNSGSRVLMSFHPYELPSWAGRPKMALAWDAVALFLKHNGALQLPV